MDGIPISCKFIPIKICQFGKWTDNPILNEKQQGLNIGSIYNENLLAR